MTEPAVRPRSVAPGAMPSSAIVRLRGLTKEFAVRQSWRGLVRSPLRRATVEVLRDVSCDIHAGELFGLLGPNGAGKSTLLKILSTVVTPDAGSAIIAGHDVRRDPARVRRVLASVIADERSLFWRLSARENLRLYATMYGLRGQRQRDRVDEVLHIVDLAGSADDKLTGSFSSGMKQRLLIARALLTRPAVLLLDEPTRALDPLSARRLRSFLREQVVAEQGCTVLLATHNAEEALELCDRVAVLHRGRLLAVGSVDDLTMHLAGERFRMWTRDPRHRSIAALAGEGVLVRVEVHPPDADGWSCVDADIPGGLDRAAQVVAALSRASVPIARFERMSLSLADLIAGIVERPAREPDRA